jgi:hypothetical protein
MRYMGTRLSTYSFKNFILYPNNQMASNIPRRRQPQAQSTTITPNSSKEVDQQPLKGGGPLMRP